MTKEDPHAVEGLVPVWDMNGLLWLRDAPLPQGGEDLAMRFFNCNCYKSELVDRMIGDRRSRNFVEGRLTIASSGLPSSQCLLELEVSAPAQRLSICCADRKARLLPSIPCASAKSFYKCLLPSRLQGGG